MVTRKILSGERSKRLLRRDLDGRDLEHRRSLLESLSWGQTCKRFVEVLRSVGDRGPDTARLFIDGPENLS